MKRQHENFQLIRDGAVGCAAGSIALPRRGSLRYLSLRVIAVLKSCLMVIKSKRYSCQKSGLSSDQSIDMRNLFARVCLVLVACSLAYGQAAETVSPKAAGTITTTSRNVVLDVIVTDKDGRPIHGLKADDFTILENGRPQHVKGFEEYRPDAQSAKSPLSVNLPADTYTNYVSGDAPGAVNIILFDSLNTDRQNLARARQQLLLYLGKLPDNTRIALFTLDGSLHLVHGFTENSRELIEAAQQLSSNAHPIMRKARDVSEEQAMAAEAGLIKSPKMYRSFVNFLWSEYEGKIEARTELTMEALDELARSMAVVPGRKNLIWISGGLPFDPASTTPQMQKTAAQLAAHTRLRFTPSTFVALPGLGRTVPLGVPTYLDYRTATTRRPLDKPKSLPGCGKP